MLPTELFICNYVNGSGMDDLSDAFDSFNAWADDQGIDDLTIFVLTPGFFSEDVDYDVVGMNIWPDGAAFGSGNAAISGDPDALASFEDVVECSAHALYALVGVEPPVEDPQTGGLFEFSNCTMRGNRSNDEGIATVAAAAALFDRWNVNDAHAALFNLAGLPADTAYNFKWLTYYPSFESWGALFDGIVGDDAIAEVDATIGPMMQCDSSRIYGTTVMRMGVAE